MIQRDALNCNVSSLINKKQFLWIQHHNCIKEKFDNLWIVKNFSKPSELTHTKILVLELRQLVMSQYDWLIAVKYFNGFSWTYQSSKELDGSSYTAQVSSYGGGGFVQDLDVDMATSQPLVTVLHDNLWIDRATRVVFMDFTVYNANINLFCVIK